MPGVKADGMGELVGDAVAEQPRHLQTIEDFKRVGHDVSLYAATRDRALDRALAVDQHERSRLER